MRHDARGCNESWFSAFLGPGSRRPSLLECPPNSSGGAERRLWLRGTTLRGLHLYLCCTLVYELPSGDQFHHATLFRKRSAVRISRSFFAGNGRSRFSRFCSGKAGNNAASMQGVFGSAVRYTLLLFLPSATCAKSE